jgi:hypothetical protein
LYAACWRHSELIARKRCTLSTASTANLPSRQLVYKRTYVVTISQIELTSDSPVFDGQSMIAQSSDFSPT